ncbi:MAG: carbon-nitrogen hydrolase family protein [Candidatus Hodarchaeales archaeon]|jgi:predicted amidohydrolase
MVSKNELIVTAIQPLIKMNAFEYNLKHYRQLFDEFSTVIQASNVLCFPEYWNGIRKDQLTETIQKKSFEFLKKTASTLSLWVVGGSHLVRDGEKIMNRAHVLNPTGQLIGVYDKRNLFGYEKFQEISPGKNDFFWEINDWKATVKLCSDLWNTAEFYYNPQCLLY